VKGSPGPPRPRRSIRPTRTSPRQLWLTCSAYPSAPNSTRAIWVAVNPGFAQMVLSTSSSSMAAQSVPQAGQSRPVWEDIGRYVRCRRRGRQVQRAAVVRTTNSESPANMLRARNFMMCKPSSFVPRHSRLRTPSRRATHFRRRARRVRLRRAAVRVVAQWSTGVISSRFPPDSPDHCNYRWNQSGTSRPDE
jgi:hypothetical protein